MSCGDGLQTDSIHRTCTQYQLTCPGIEILQWNKDTWNLIPRPAEWNTVLLIHCRLTFSVSINLLMTSFTNMGRSSTHWQYSMIILSINDRMLHTKNGRRCVNGDCQLSFLWCKRPQRCLPNYGKTLTTNNEVFAGWLARLDIWGAWPLILSGWQGYTYGRKYHPWWSEKREPPTITDNI